MPFFSPYISKEDKRAVIKALGSTLLTDGPTLRKFESAFAKFTKAKYAIGVSNATSALHLSLKALGISKGDEVIVPALTFVATASSVLLTNATPVFADIEKNDYNISPNSIRKNITQKTRAIVVVHFAGNPCKMDEISRIAQQHGLFVIEDCAHAIGAKYKNQHVGTFGDAGCFSFYPTKNITTIEGGMIITNSKKIANYVSTARNHGITKSLVERYSKGRPWDYDVFEAGYNYRLDEIRASLGISQLKRINKLNSQRKKAFEYYNRKLQSVKGIITPQPSKNINHAYHLYILKIQKEFKISRDALYEKLLRNGIQSSVHYKPLSEFTTFKKLGKSYNILENTREFYKQAISLPFYPQISKNKQDLVISCITS